MSELVNPEQKKRGRKRKESPVATPLLPTNNDTAASKVSTFSASNVATAVKKTEEVNITISIEENDPIVNDTATKKRGRKPKGGKLIVAPTEKKNTTAPIANIILHLKCSMQDLTEHNTIINKMVTDPLVYNPSMPPNILAYNKADLSLYNIREVGSIDKDIAYNEIDQPVSIPSNSICKACSANMAEEQVIEEEDAGINIKDVNTKLKKLKIKLYKNQNQDKKSACFWCTYDFDNPSCYIPKYEMDGEIYGYGSFCRPECAVAHLMKENIDDSTKFERYHLLNQIYSKVYDFKKNIKPAPNPYYLLDKFYGSLTIQEYRKLLKTEHMLLVIDKPLTRILPEIHEDNDDFISNIYGTAPSNQTQTSGVYKVKRESERQKGQSKSSILKEQFGV
jgi:hypothetical protein